MSKDIINEADELQEDPVLDETEDTLEPEEETEEGNQAIFAAGVFRRCGEGGNPFLKTLPCPQRQHDIVPAFLQTAAQQITARGVRRKRLAQ